MDNKSTGVGIIFLALLATILGVSVYPSLPADMAAHWSITGQVDGYIPKLWGIFIFPYIILATFMLWWGIPHLEPLHKNINAFRKSYNGFWFVLAVFFFYIYALMVGANVGWQFNFGQALAPAVALLFASMAVLLQYSRRNYFIGIRTPWTLSSDKIWKRTNILGSHMFYFCAVWALAGAIYPMYLMWFIFAPLTTTVLITTVYSYIEFRRQ